MKLYRSIHLLGIILLAVSAGAQANNKRLMSVADIQQAVGVSSPDNRFDKLASLGLAYSPATLDRGLTCGNGSPDFGETCDDGNTEILDGCDDNCQIEAGSDCTAAIAGSAFANAISDGSFELDDDSWDLSNLSSGSQGNPEFDPDESFDGDFLIRLVFSPDGINDTITQTVDVPLDATDLTFAWWGVANNAPAACGGPGTELRLKVGGDQLWANTDVGEAACSGSFPTPYPWNLITLDVTPYVGTTVEILFEYDYVFATGAEANFFIDDFRIDTPLAEPTDPIPSSCLVGMCGDGILSSGEACDDGNTDSLDGCSETCTIEEDTFVCINTLADDPIAIINGALSQTNDITDRSLEQGSPNPDWVEEGTVFEPICSEAFCGANLATDGEFFAWFGGASEENHQTLTQTTVISTAATELTFELLVGVCDGPTDVFRVLIDGNTEYEYFCTDTLDAVQTVDLTGGGMFGGFYTDGAEHEIQFTSDTFSVNEGNSNFFVDEIDIVSLVTPDRDPVGSDCFELDGICDAGGDVGFGIEKFEGGLGIMSTVEIGTLSAENEWTTTADEWTVVGDPSGCGSFGFDPADPDAAVANWPGGNLTGGSGEAACIDADGGAESLALPDTLSACLTVENGGTAIDPTADCQTLAYLCTPLLDTTNMTDPGITATVHYQTATQDFETPDFDDDEIFQVLVGDVPPFESTLDPTLMDPFYRSAGVIPDHDSTTLAASGSRTIGVNLDDYRNPAVQPCVDPLEDLPCTISGQQAPLDGSAMYVCIRYAGVFSWYGQVDNVAARADSCTSGDADFDLVPDDVDNCTLVANPDQRDTDGDLIGNVCDPDVDGAANCTVNFLDLAVYRAAFFSNPASPNWNPDADLNGDNFVNFLDLTIVRGFFFQAPGPSAAGCDTLLP